VAKKISDNPSYQKLRTEIGQADEFRKILSVLDPSGEKFPEIASALKKVPEFQKQLEQIATIPDDFNKYYCGRGWIAHESMESAVLTSTVHLAEQGKIDDGEAVLIEYYNPEKLKFRINFIRGVVEFKPRMRLIELALTDYFEGRYHSCVPVLLMMIDGVVNDLTKDLGLFAENVDMSAWDSIAAHESGLGELTKLIGRSRKRTNSEAIDIPYRHGILHGKELAYDNLPVAAKTWALLFSVRDWIVARRKSKPKVKPEISIQESLEELKKIKETNQLLDLWTPRKIVIGSDIQKAGIIDDYEDNTPEQATIKFVSYWLKRNYGKMSEMIVRYQSLGLTDKKIAGELREAFSSVDVTSYELVAIDDQAPAVTEIKVNISFALAKSYKSKQIIFRWIYMNGDATAITRGQSGGSWYLIDSFRLEISLLSI
jgi:hypothetical protein